MASNTVEWCQTCGKQGLNTQTVSLHVPTVAGTTHSKEATVCDRCLRLIRDQWFPSLFPHDKHPVGDIRIGDHRWVYEKVLTDTESYRADKAMESEVAPDPDEPTGS